jgi:hypothetical protein
MKLGCDEAGMGSDGIGSRPGLRSGQWQRLVEGCPEGSIAGKLFEMRFSEQFCVHFAAHFCGVVSQNFHAGLTQITLDVPL